MIGQCNTAEIYAFEEKKILKLFRHGIPRELAVDEYEKALYIQSCIENVPKANEFSVYDDRYGIVYEKIAGKDMIRVMLQSILKINHYSRMLAHTHLEIHKTKLKPEQNFTVKERLKGNITAVEALDETKKKLLLDYLAELPDGDSLCHFDYHPGNIMFQDKEPIVIDWMTAGVGDPCADVARTCLLLSYGVLPNSGFVVKKLVAIFQRHVGKIYYQEYFRLSNVAEKDVEKWLLPVAAARLSEWIPEGEKEALLAIIDQWLKKILEAV